MNFCPKCGARVTAEMLFCYKCGEKLTLDINPPQPASHIEVPPPPIARPYRNTNPMEVPPPPSYRMTIESGHPMPNISSSNSDGYITPGSRSFNHESNNYARSSRVTEENLLNPQLYNNGTSFELPPPRVIPGSEDVKSRKSGSMRNFIRKVNPLWPAKHFFITVLILGAIYGGSFFFDDIAGADNDVIFEWGISRNAVIERLNYQNISHSIKDNAGSEVVAEIYNSTIDFPFRKELLKDKKLIISYYFNSAENLRSISIVIPQIKRVEIYPVSTKIGEHYTFDPTNSNPDEFAYITNDTKIWFIVRNEVGDNVDAVITLTSRTIR